MPEAQHWDGQHEIPLNLILVGGENPRKRFDEEALEELAESIERDGLLQPILVRPVPSSEEGELINRAREADALPEDTDGWADHDGPLYELVSGERRLRAHRRLGREEIRAEVRAMPRESAVRIRLVENVQREDLDELEEAAAYRRMVDDLGYEVEEIAEEVGKSVSYVYQRMKLLELAEPVQEALAKGDITAGHAIEIARLQTPALQERALEATTVSSTFNTRQGTLSVRDLREWIRANTHLDLHAAPWKKDDAKLLPQAGSCTDCPKRTGQAAELWPEVEDDAVCTDPDCYHRKMVAYVEREAERLEDEGTDFVRISTELWSVVSGQRLEQAKVQGRVGRSVTSETLGKNGYARLDGDVDSCEHEVVGLIVDGGEIGETVPVCVEPDCDVHHGSKEADSDPEDDRRQKVWKRNRHHDSRVRSGARRRMAERLLEAELAPETRLEIALVRLWDALWVDNQRAAAEALTALGLDGHDGDDLADWASGRSQEELTHALLTMSLAQGLGGSTNARPPAAYRIDGEVPERLLGTSVETLEAELREETDWVLPEDLPGFCWLIPDDKAGIHWTYHAAVDGRRPACGEELGEVEERAQEPKGWEPELCDGCWAEIADLQTSAMEDDTD